MLYQAVGLFNIIFAVPSEYHVHDCQGGYAVVLLQAEYRVALKLFHQFSARCPFDLFECRYQETTGSESSLRNLHDVFGPFLLQTFFQIGVR